MSIELITLVHYRLDEAIATYNVSKPSATLPQLNLVAMQNGLNLRVASDFNKAIDYLIKSKYLN